MIDNKHDLIARLKEARLHLGKKSGDFARGAGIDPRNYSSIENDKRAIGERVIMDICNAYGINYKWLLTGEGEMIKKSPGEVLEIPAKELVQMSTESFVTRIMKMYSEGEIYSAAVVQKMMDEKNAKIEEKDAKIAELQKRIWELEQEQRNE